MSPPSASSSATPKSQLLLWSHHSSSSFASPLPPLLQPPPPPLAPRPNLGTYSSRIPQGFEIGVEKSHSKRTRISQKNQSFYGRPIGDFPTDGTYGNENEEKKRRRGWKGECKDAVVDHLAAASASTSVSSAPPKNDPSSPLPPASFPHSTPYSQPTTVL